MADKETAPQPDELDPRAKLGDLAALLEENGLLPPKGFAAPNKEPDELDPRAKLGDCAALLEENGLLAPKAAAPDVPNVKLEEEDAGASFAFIDIKCCTILLRSSAFSETPEMSKTHSFNSSSLHPTTFGPSMSLLAHELWYFAKPSTVAISAATSALVMVKSGLRLEAAAADAPPTTDATAATAGNAALEDDVADKETAPKPDELPGATVAVA